MESARGNVCFVCYYRDDCFVTYRLNAGVVCVADSGITAMPSFDDIDEILNSSGITADAVTGDGMAEAASVPLPGMTVSC